MICGIDIGGTFTRIGAVDETFTVHDLQRVKTSEIADDFSAFLKAYVKTHPSIHRIVMGFPGVVNPQTHAIVKIPNQPALERLDIQALGRALNLPIDIDKDTYHLFRYDQRKGDLLNHLNLLGFYLGTGLGHVMYLNGQIHYGDDFAAAELGHQALKHGEKPCPCGLKGCFETVVSGHYLAHLHETYFKTVPFDDLFRQTVDSDHRDVIDTFVDDFAFIIASQMHILDVRHIIIGGGIPVMKDFPKVQLVDRIHVHLRKSHLIPANIYFSENPTEQGVIGAAIAGYEKE